MSALSRKKNVERKELMAQVKKKDAAMDRKKMRADKTRTALAGKCGAKRRRKRDSGAPSPEITYCQHRAGWGTNHPGVGRCKLHGGNLPTHSLNAYKQDAIFMGAEKDINPFDAIMWCIRIKAGEIEWLSEQMKE